MDARVPRSWRACLPPEPSSLPLGLTDRPCRMDDRRKIDFAVFGLPVFGGLPICADATIVSPLTTEGVTHPRCMHDADVVLDGAINEKPTSK